MVQAHARNPHARSHGVETSPERDHSTHSPSTIDPPHHQVTAFTVEAMQRTGASLRAADRRARRARAGSGVPAPGIRRCAKLGDQQHECAAS